MTGDIGTKLRTWQLIFSEFALIRYRVRVEIEYLIALSEYLPQLSDLNTEEVKTWLRNVYKDFTEEDALRVKEIEKVTNHDVKAVEYFIKEKQTISWLKIS